jgi:hypothetical protein
VDHKLWASLDCHFWITLWYSLTVSYGRLRFFPKCIWTPTFSAKHSNLASVVWHTSLMLFHFITVTTKIQWRRGKCILIDPWRSLFVPFSLYCPSSGQCIICPFLDLWIAITLWYISPVTYVWSSLLVNNKYGVPYFLHSDK